VYEQGNFRITRSQGADKNREGLYTVYPANYVITSELEEGITKPEHHIYRKSGLSQPSASGVTDGVSRKGFVHRTPEKLSWWQDRDD
jgi:hypothetical protein